MFRWSIPFNTGGQHGLFDLPLLIWQVKVLQAILYSFAASLHVIAFCDASLANSISHLLNNQDIVLIQVSFCGTSSLC